MPRSWSFTAGQELVKRLDTYELEHTGLLSQIVELVSSKFMPIITRHALSGRAHVNSENPIFNEPLAIPMLIDVFSERGYHAAVDKQIQGPRSASTWSRGEIKSGVKAVYRIEVHFETSKIRRGGGPTPGPTPLFDAVVCLLAPPALLCSRERRYHRLP